MFVLSFGGYFKLLEYRCLNWANRPGQGKTGRTVGLVWSSTVTPSSNERPKHSFCNACSQRQYWIQPISLLVYWACYFAESGYFLNSTQLSTYTLTTECCISLGRAYTCSGFYCCSCTISSIYDRVNVFITTSTCWLAPKSVTHDSAIHTRGYTLTEVCESHAICEF